jgi:hypothetical protein
MFRKYMSLVLVGMLLNLTFYSTAIANTEKDAKFAEKVKTNIVKLGIGQNARIKVKLKDGTKLKGYVSQINENSFVVTNETNGMTTEVPYPQAKQVKGNNMSTGVKIAIGIGILIGIVVVLALIVKSGGGGF